jgi:eukaryotic-like serine/threonine-protein kinase
MMISDLFVMPKDLAFIPVSTLGRDEAHKLDGSDGDILLTRRRGRSGSKVITEDAAELLQLFREPKTIVQAVIEYTSARKLDAEATLENAFPMFDFLIKSHFLLPADSEDRQHEAARLEPGGGSRGLDGRASGQRP